LKSLKGTISATFNDIEVHFRALVVISIFPAALTLIVSMLAKLLSINLLSYMLAANKGLDWLRRVNFPLSLILELTGWFIVALWFTIIVQYMNAPKKPKLVPPSSSMRNASFVFLYSFLFSGITTLLIVGFVQFIFFYSGAGLGTIGTVTIPWRQGGILLLVPMVLVFALAIWITCVTSVNMPRIAMGYRPNLLTEVIQYSRGVRTGLILRSVALFAVTIVLLFGFANLILPLLFGAFIPVDGMLKMRSFAEMISTQITMTKLSIALDPLLISLGSFFVWLFSLFLVEASRHIENRV
jgi:hypothetical protein